MKQLPNPPVMAGPDPIGANSRQLAAQFVILGLAPRIRVGTYRPNKRLDFNGRALTDARVKPEHDEGETP